MTIGLCGRVLRVVLSSLLASVLLPFVLASPLIAAEENHEEHHRAKIVGGYFEEWSIYFARYNIANLQANGVADKLTHLSYAFGNATPTGCAIADPWADYQTRLEPGFHSFTDVLRHEPRAVLQREGANLITHLAGDARLLLGWPVAIACLAGIVLAAACSDAATAPTLAPSSAAAS